ncbi:hypothetical protein ACFL2U_01060 [Patescibacteria group bacterium]
MQEYIESLFFTGSLLILGIALFLIGINNFIVLDIESVPLFSFIKTYIACIIGAILVIGMAILSLVLIRDYNKKVSF